MPDFLVAVQYVDGGFVEGSVMHWPGAFPKRQIARLWVRPLRGAQQWEVGGHATFAAVPGDPLEVFTVDVRDGQVVGDRWRVYADRPPEVDVIDLPRDSPSLPPPSAFIPMIEVKRTAAHRPKGWVGNLDWLLLRRRRR